MYWGAKYPAAKARETTPRRIAAAKRFLKKERDRYALFAGEVAAEQPTPEERIQNHEEGFVDYWQNLRDFRAKSWRKARQLLAELSPDFREACLTIWNRKRYPADPMYLIELIRKAASGECDPAAQVKELDRLRKIGHQARENTDYSKAAAWTAYYEGQGPKPTTEINDATATGERGEVHPAERQAEAAQAGVRRETQGQAAPAAPRAR